MVQAYILIQTEVGKAASVAKAIAAISGVTMAEDVTGPYDVIARVEASNVDDLGRLVIAKLQDVARHHPHPHLHGRPRLRPTLTTHPHDGDALRRRRAALRPARGPPRWRSPPQASAPVCTSPAWPVTVAGHTRVPTDPESGSAAAWGDPAVIARCGLEPLGPTTDDCVTVDGVDWVVRPSATDRSPRPTGATPPSRCWHPPPTVPCPCSCRPSPPSASSLPDERPALLLRAYAVRPRRGQVGTDRFVPRRARSSTQRRPVRRSRASSSSSSMSSA